MLKKITIVALGLVLSVHGLATARAVEKDIVDTAIAAGSFKTLAAALQAAGLVDALKGQGPFTVFAPTDEAFAKLPCGTVQTLLKPENKDQLVSVLKYHVVPGKVLAADVVKLSDASTLQGQKVTIKAADGQVAVNTARVVKTDLVTSNGVIHVVDSVLLPPACSASSASGCCPASAGAKACPASGTCPVSGGCPAAGSCPTKCPKSA